MKSDNKFKYRLIFHWRRSCFFAVVYLLNSAIFFSMPAFSEFLSEKDPGYAALARIQKGICESRPTHPCEVPLERCINLVKILVKENYPGDQGLEKRLSDMCKNSATPYEIGGTHELLSGRVGVVQKIAKSLNIELPKSIVVGAIPLGGVNAEVQVESKETPPIIMFNLRLLEFANELAKVSAQSIPIHKVGKSYGFVSDEIETRSYIDAHPELISQISDLIFYFQGQKISSRISPNEISRTVQIVYTTGIEVFAAAHEVGHIYLKHPSSSFDVLTFLRDLPGSFKTNASNVPLAIRELEADAFALAILAKYQDEKLSDKGQNPFFAAMLRSVEFYFIAQEIMSAAEKIKNKENDELSNDTSVVRQAIEEIALCAQNIGCRLAELKAVKIALAKIDEHPPHKMRRAIVSEFAKKSGLLIDPDIDGIASLVNRNIGILWEMAQPTLKERYEMRR